ncbi:TOM70 [Acrasis kona]|uniref:TOM70 n=1 Tax=Acrasis kona TaxID=1008807 RepID=A0AAW2YRV6_9EUKA
MEEKDRANQLYKQKQYSEAIVEYNKAISKGLPADELIKTYNNISLCHQIQNNHPEAIESSTQAISLNPNLGRSYERRAKAFQQSGKLDDAFLDIIQGEVRDPNHKALSAMKEEFYKKYNYLDLNDLIKMYSSITSAYIVSTRVIKRIEQKKHHDVWEMEDYFDAANEDRKFDVPCPPPSFLTNEQLISQARDSRLNLKSKHANNPTHTFQTVIDEEQIVFNLYNKYAQGSIRPQGLSNVSFSNAVHALLKKNKNVQIKFLCEKDFKLKTIKDCGIKFGAVRCKSITWHGIAFGNVVVRDYDPHVWCLFKSNEDDYELNVDLMCAQFDHYSYLRNTHFQVRLFDSETLSQERSLNIEYSDYQGLYKESSRREPLWGVQLKEFASDKYERELDNQVARVIYNRISQKFMKHLQDVGFVPRPKMF